LIPCNFYGKNTRVWKLAQCLTHTKSAIAEQKMRVVQYVVPKTAIKQQHIEAQQPQPSFRPSHSPHPAKGFACCDAP
jgi:hypothetical protein